MIVQFEYMSGEDPQLGATLAPHAIQGIQSKGEQLRPFFAGLANDSTVWAISIECGRSDCKREALGRQLSGDESDNKHCACR